MAQPRAKIPRTSAKPVPFELDFSHWEQLEQAYGYSISPIQRDKIVKITKRSRRTSGVM